MHNNGNIIDNKFLGLFTDLYQLKMAQSYLREEMQTKATFQLFARSLNSHRSYLVSAGLEPLLDHLQQFKFSSESLNFLSETSLFSSDFLHYLEGFNFTGDIRAIPEGRVYFFDEPIIEALGLHSVNVGEELFTPQFARCRVMFADILDSSH